eukprot:TRINITY_DN4725_c0_g2_i2.p1 TRINITY_DN4725_c0_g2~~TRINITY_DN4725_c0_g2_i2.p1  ORF type:complete len:167 (-),score=26.27 TRINITY_DN4725_c0_g2_i2:45-545(-)
MATKRGIKCFQKLYTFQRSTKERQARRLCTDSNTKKNKQTVLLDGTPMVCRAYYGLRHAIPTNWSGIPIAGVFSYLKMLLKIMKEWQYDYIGVCFDSAGPTFRAEMMETYKKNRSALPKELSRQFPIARQGTEAFGVACISEKGYEADDIIATYSSWAINEGHTVL